VAVDAADPTTWPSATILLRGGVGGVEELRESLQRDGSWSVRSRPFTPFRLLAGSVRNNRVRRTTVGKAASRGAVMVPTDDPGDPPYHCELSGLTPEEFDSILGPPEPNPVPAGDRWGSQ
jgi:hypothetical protein